jgi:hypothetical protein
MKKNIKYFFLVVVNILFIFIAYLVVSAGNKADAFFDVAVNETSHFYIPSNLVYINGSYLTLDRIISLEENQDGNAIYLSDDNISNQEGDKFFLNFSSAFYIPIESQVDDLIKKKYENQKKTESDAISDADYLESNLLEEDLMQLEDYKFTAPVSGEYDVLVLEESALNQDKGVVFLFDNQVLKKNSYQIKNEKFILWGQVNLSAGQHEFQVNSDDVPIEFIKSSEIILSLKSPIALNSNPLRFTKINPTKYIVNVKNLKKEPFLLVFLESFNKDWEIFKVVDNDKQYFWNNWFKQSDFKNHHYLINGFANSWLIDQPNLEGEETFIIEYTQQRNFYFSLFIVFVVLLFCFNYLIIKVHILCPKK